MLVLHDPRLSTPKTHPDACTSCDFRRLAQDLLGQGARDGKVGDDDAIAAILAPCLKQLPAESTLQHGGGGEHHAGADVVKGVARLEVRDVPVELVMVWQTGVATGDSDIRTSMSTPCRKALVLVGALVGCIQAS